LTDIKRSGKGRQSSGLPRGSSLAITLTGLGWLVCSGCAVPQPRGQGQLQRLVEPTTQRSFYLYLPKDYVQANEASRAARRWPVVVTFHGMKPYDIAYYQALEWEEEADRYGYIVVAPVLNTFVFLFGEFPLRHVNAALKSDEQATLAILDHVFRTTHADPSNVLSTSWSSGGYIAHYMLNRHPDRFTCLAVRQSNFSASVLDATRTSESLYHPVLILSTQNDFGICKEESRAAIKWYETHGYKNFAWVYINRLGHERTPDIAADFFARVSGMTPNRPPRVLVDRQAIDGNAAGLALLSGNLGEMQKPPGALASDDSQGELPPRATTRRRPVALAANPPTQPPPRTEMAPTANPRPQPTPARNAPTTKPAPPLAPLGVRVSSAIGFEPLLLVYSAECPPDWYRSADFYWTLNGKKIGHGANGQRTITEPGDYILELLVVTKDGAEHRAARRVRVLKSLETSAAPTKELGP